MTYFKWDVIQFDDVEWSTPKKIQERKYLINLNDSPSCSEMPGHLKYYTSLFLNKKTEGTKVVWFLKWGHRIYLKYSKILNKTKKFAPLTHILNTFVMGGKRRATSCVGLVSLGFTSFGYWKFEMRGKKNAEWNLIRF